MRDVLTPALALLAYPGLLASALAGWLADLGAAWALRARRPALLTAARGWLRGLRGGRGWPIPVSLASLMAMLASAQLAAPFNPVAPALHNVLVAALSLCLAGWLAWLWGGRQGGPDPGLLVTVQASWLLAVLAPALLAQNLRPQVLGAVAVAQLRPLKLACALLYLLCLPALLQLLPARRGRSEEDAAPTSRSSVETGWGLPGTVLWLPCCGLFASLFFAPGADDLLGLVRFFGLSGLAAVCAIGLAGLLVHRRATAVRLLYPGAVSALAGLTLLIALGTLWLVR